MLRIHLGENDRFAKRPLYEEILERCRQAGVHLAVVYRGIEGYGASTLVHRRGLFGRSGDAPIVVTIIGEETQMASLSSSLEEIVDEGLIAISSVELIAFGDNTAS